MLFDTQGFSQDQIDKAFNALIVDEAPRFCRLGFFARQFEFYIDQYSQMQCFADSASLIINSNGVVTCTLKHDNKPRLTLVGDAAYTQFAICTLIARREDIAK